MVKRKLAKKTAATWAAVLLQRDNHQVRTRSAASILSAILVTT